MNDIPTILASQTYHRSSHHSKHVGKRK